MNALLETHPHLLPALEDAMRVYDGETARHSVRVGHLADLLGEAINLGFADRIALRWAGLLHDLGKLSVSEDLLAKTGPLTPREWREVQRHPAVGADILRKVSPHLGPIADGVRAHHEWFDGSGYPDGLAEEAIPLAGRIVAVVDVFDSVTHRRAYRDHDYTRVAAIELLREEAGSHLDPALVAAFTDLVAAGALED